MAIKERAPKEKSIIQLATEELATRLGITPENLIKELESRAGTPNCLQPHEVEFLGSLSKDRKDHLDGCGFCKTLIEGSHPDVQRAQEFAAVAAAAWKAQQVRPPTEQHLAASR
jgi:hypothetical protein